ncbi:hypothetical protein ACRAQ7_08485 [Erythrobacter sp. W53]|uniref:hypothetical protein n=1 Tax=Erythrobacter sp. W53 TaxID=3425947 RepID=UPI003D76810B
MIPALHSDFGISHVKDGGIAPAIKGGEAQFTSVLDDAQSADSGKAEGSALPPSGKSLPVAAPDGLAPDALPPVAPALIDADISPPGNLHFDFSDLGRANDAPAIPISPEILDSDVNLGVGGIGNEQLAAGKTELAPEATQRNNAATISYEDLFALRGGAGEALETAPAPKQIDEAPLQAGKAAALPGTAPSSVPGELAATIAAPAGAKQTGSPLAQAGLANAPAIATQASALAPGSLPGPTATPSHLQAVNAPSDQAADFASGEQSSRPTPQIGTALAAATKSAIPAEALASLVSETAQQTSQTPQALAPATQPASATGTGAPSLPEAMSTPQRQLETLIDNLAQARETGRAARGDIVMRHAEFGTIAVRFDHSDGDLTARMSSRDPGFAPAAQAALAERGQMVVAAASDSSLAQNRGQDAQSQSGNGQQREQGPALHNGASSQFGNQSGDQAHGDRNERGPDAGIAANKDISTGSISSVAPDGMFA